MSFWTKLDVCITFIGYEKHYQVQVLWPMISAVNGVSKLLYLSLIVDNDDTACMLLRPSGLHTRRNVTIK
jgi:hypothetical protein